MSDAKPCSVSSCDRLAVTRRLCSGHYSRLVAKGDVLSDIPLRFASRKQALCAVVDCARLVHGKGYCTKHYQRYARTGAAELAAKPEHCSVGDCGRPRRTGGFCEVHYQRWWKHGDPLYAARERDSKPPTHCTEAGCSAPHYAKGQCRKHNAAARYAANQDAIRERNRLHYEANKPMYFGNAARRRQRVRVDMDAFDRMLSTGYRQAIAGDDCNYCGAPSATVDHFYPLIKGGTDHFWNLTPACARCNLSKGSHCGTWFLLQPAIGSAARRIKAA